MKTMELVKFTVADYMALPEGYPAELIEGQLVKTPSPRYGHQRLVGDLHLALTDMLDRHRVVLSPIDVFVDRENVLQPDLAVLAAPLPADAERIGIPLLVVEILSPGTARRDRDVKSGIYLRAGVAEVWLVDREAGTVEIRRPSGEPLVHGAGETVRSAAAPEISLVLADLLD